LGGGGKQVVKGEDIPFYNLVGGWGTVRGKMLVEKKFLIELYVNRG